MPRIWVKRGTGGIPSSIVVQNDDLVDDVKDAVFRKYPVALGRNYDSPDVAICLHYRIKSSTLELRSLAVDERIMDVINSTFPSGQSTDEALVVQVPASSIGLWTIVRILT